MNLQCDQMWQEHLMSTPLGFYWGGSKPEGGGGMESCDTFLIHMSGLWARKTQIAGGWTSWGSTGISMWSRLSLLGLYIIGASWWSMDVGTLYYVAKLLTWQLRAPKLQRGLESTH